MKPPVVKVPAGYSLTIEAREERVTYNGVFWEPLPIGPATVVTASVTDDLTITTFGHVPMRLNLTVTGRQDQVGPVIAAVLRELANEPERDATELPEMGQPEFAQPKAANP